MGPGPPPPCCGGGHRAGTAGPRRRHLRLLPTVYSGDGEGTGWRPRRSPTASRPCWSRATWTGCAPRRCAGTLRLDVRNEALETHYIDHLQLLEVGPRRGELSCPTRRACRDLRRLRAVRQRSDRGGTRCPRPWPMRDGEAFLRPPPAGRGRDGDLDGLDWTSRAPLPDGADRWRSCSARATALEHGPLLRRDVGLARTARPGLDGLDLDQITDAVDLGRWVSAPGDCGSCLWRDGVFGRWLVCPNPGRSPGEDVAVAARCPRRSPSSACAVVHAGPGEGSPRGPRAREPPRCARFRLRSSSGSDRRARSRRARLPARLRGSRPARRVPGSASRASSTPARPRGLEPDVLLSSQGYYTEWIACRWCARDPEAFSLRPITRCGRAAPVEEVWSSIENASAPPHPGPLIGSDEPFHGAGR